MALALRCQPPWMLARYIGRVLVSLYPDLGSIRGKHSLDSSEYRVPCQYTPLARVSFAPPDGGVEYTRRRCALMTRSDVGPAVPAVKVSCRLSAENPPPRCSTAGGWSCLLLSQCAFGQRRRARTGREPAGSGADISAPGGPLCITGNLPLPGGPVKWGEMPRPGRRIARERGVAAEWDDRPSAHPC